MVSEKKNPCLVMPIGDLRDGFFYPTLTLIIDSYKTNATGVQAI